MTTQTQAVEGLRQSRTGKRPIALPKGVTATLKDRSIEVKGPKGTLARALPENVNVKVEAGNIAIMPTIGGRDGARYQGLTRALLAGMVLGVAEGYTRTLQLVGTGYRAEVKGTTLNLSLGFSHPIAFPLPKGVKCDIPAESKGTLLILTGSDKEVMGQTAAKIRGFRPPEPYGGKGVRYQNEKVREKAGKAAKAGGK
ncbi:MAG TPA: 50S ribosomal protein L6 [Polyangiaceae bacterium]|jgi:large subunit ribosomal protein L6|nr:50S ribosomal protein L6 [Polyangiaceae bacterium]